MFADRLHLLGEFAQVSLGHGRILLRMEGSRGTNHHRHIFWRPNLHYARWYLAAAHEEPVTNVFDERQIG